MPNTQSNQDWIAQLEKDMILVKAKDRSFMFQDKVNNTFALDYYLCKYPVTQGLWKAVMDKNEVPCRFKGDHRPMETISWNDIKDDFLPALKKKTGIDYRLSSEVEWEYAALGGHLKGKQNYIYAGSNRLKEVGWYNNNSHGETKPVGLKLPNQLGLFDMSGNVWEWCEDVWHENDEIAKTSKKDGTAWMEGGDQKRRVVRGGSWNYYTDISRVANRLRYSTDNRFNSIGFRLARY